MSSAMFFVLLVFKIKLVASYMKKIIYIYVVINAIIRLALRISRDFR